MARERCFCDHKFGFFSFFQELDQQSRHLGANLCSFSRAKPCSSSQGKKLDAPLPEKGEEAVGAGKERGETLEGGREGGGGGVCHTERTDDRPSESDRQPVHPLSLPRSDPRSKPPRAPPPPPTPPPRRDLRSRCSLAASGAQPPKCAPPADAPSLRLLSLRGRLERGSWTRVRVEPKPASERGESL